MSQVTEKIVDRPRFEPAGFHDVEIPQVDDTAFRQLFRSAADGKREHAQSVREDAIDLTVGKPTVSCQQDGGSDESEYHDEQQPTVQTGGGSRKEGGEDSEKNNSNTNLLMSLASAFNPQADRRIFSDFETAGLPRKEIIRLAHALHESVVAGRQTVSLGLRVPVLGELRFDVRIAGKVVLIHAFVESEQAAQALALAVSTLRDKLEEHQLILGRLDVTTMDDRTDEQENEEDADAGTSRKKRKRSRELPLPSLNQLDEAE